MNIRSPLISPIRLDAVLSAVALGVCHRFNKNQAFTVAGYFSHHSNLGMTDPNPGIDVLGVNLGLVWQY